MYYIAKCDFDKKRCPFSSPVAVILPHPLYTQSTCKLECRQHELQQQFFIIIFDCCSTLNIPVPNAYYGHGSGGILIDDINCIGNESNIGNCQHAMWGSNNCDHSEDASAMCLTG